MNTIIDEIRHTHPVEHQAGAAILELQDVTLRYETGVVLDSISFRLQAGERVAVIGPNGAGKSTMFKVIAGVLQPGQGTVSVYGHQPGGHICISYLPQRSHVDWRFPVSVADVVMMGRVGKMGLLRWPSRSDWAAVHQALEEVDLAAYVRRQISELSGGQQQRMFIARALAQEAELMLMDEPLTGLDLQSEEAIFKVLDNLRHRKVTVMVATHDLEQATQRFDRVMLLNRRLLGFGLARDVFTSDRLVAAYGGHLHLLPSADGFLVLGDTCCEEGEET
jgi:manganese/iron transport system ATP-binding protein